MRYATRIICAALVEIEKEDWARRMPRLLCRACYAENLARAQDLPPKSALIALIERRCDAVVADAWPSMRCSLLC
jgi:transposase